MDYGQNSVQNLLLTAQGSTGTYLVGQHNLLYNADKRSGYSVSQAGDIVFSPTSALFDGSELVYLVSGNIEPTTPTVISVIFPAIHSQMSYWYFGWTSRFYHPNPYIVARLCHLIPPLPESSRYVGWLCHGQYLAIYLVHGYVIAVYPPLPKKTAAQSAQNTMRLLPLGAIVHLSCAK